MLIQYFNVKFSKIIVKNKRAQNKFFLSHLVILFSLLETPWIYINKIYYV